MSKDLFLVGALSMAMFITGASFASDDSIDTIDQHLNSDGVPITRFNATHEQRKELINEDQNEIIDLQRQMDTIRFDWTIEDDVKMHRLESMEKQIESLRYEIHNLE